MPPIISRNPIFDLNFPFRKIRPATNKIIFLSMEGSVTEEDYFDRMKDLFDDIKSRVQFISVAEEAVHTKPRGRTREQQILLSKCRP